MQSDSQILKDGAEALAEIILDIFLETEKESTMVNDNLEGVQEDE